MRKGRCAAWRWWHVVVSLGGAWPVLSGCGGIAANDPDGGAAGDTAASGNSDVTGGGASGSGARDDGCYSPGRNLAHVFEADARGCACDQARDRDLCVRGVALTCDAGVWGASEDDEACQHSRIVFVSPETCIARGGVPTVAGGSSLPEAVCKTGFDIGFIDSSSPGWDGGGFCCSADAGPQLEPCGGAAAHRCAANDYCAYFEGQMCGRADASSYCKPRPTACGEVAAPVCGCDGTTYDNACSAHRAGVGVDSSAACPHPTTP